MKSLQSLQLYTVLFVFASIVITSANGRVAFEKLTDFDFSGQTYYSVKNLSLYECQGWCREEADCQAAAFSFVVNPLTPAQETLCQLQNDSSAHNPSAVPQRSASMYYMVKLQVRIFAWTCFCNNNSYSNNPHIFHFSYEVTTFACDHGPLSAYQTKSFVVLIMHWFTPVQRKLVCRLVWMRFAFISDVHLMTY